ncbi:cytochrome P450 [Cohnella cholangitidis]|uniref:Cytochrome P450 n=1 Tax=Cohnella cholangitidis TaxID=2598458 RepID=A0A7G5C6E4_9BACL|nr:cytochrome P450 [Cohnella cholangitidis]QMV44778.1 cytochrome P450 [Cohnella cholangitidis]
MSNQPDLRLDPYPWYAHMLEASPVVFSPEFGAYLVFRADDVRKVFSDHQTFSSAVFDGLSMELPFENQLTGMDPPRHTQLRALATHAFTPKAVLELEPRIQEIVNRLLDAMLDREEVDFVRDFAIPFPVTVIAEMLGVPEEDQDRFKLWSDMIIEISERLLTGLTESLPEHVAGYNEMLDYFRKLVHERRQDPKGDLISRLAVAEVEGRQLTDTEASNFCALLMVAGNETTTNLLTNTIRTFAEYPDQWERLVKEPGLIPQAVEEVMRFRTSVQLMFRVVRQDAEIGGVKMKAGERVVLFMGAANRDPAKIDNPNVFDITRPAGSHLTFGHGIHFCLGAPLARLEVSTALKTILGRVSEFRIPEGAVLEPLSSFNLLGLKSLPLRLERLK